MLVAHLVKSLNLFQTANVLDGMWCILQCKLAEFFCYCSVSITCSSFLLLPLLLSSVILLLHQFPDLLMVFCGICCDLELEFLPGIYFKRTELCTVAAEALCFLAFLQFLDTLVAGNEFRLGTTETQCRSLLLCKELSISQSKEDWKSIERYEFCTVPVPWLFCLDSRIVFS